MQNSKVVPVAEYRNSIDHLERIFNVDRHACVGKTESDHWAVRARKMLDVYKDLQCKRTKPEDAERMTVIVQKINDYLNEKQATPNSERKTMTEANQEPKSMAPAKKTMFNVFVTSEFETAGVKKTRWTQVGVGFPHKDGEGLNIEIVPGLSVSGSLVVMLAKSDDKEG